MKKNKRAKSLEMIKEHVINNKKEYILVSLLFIIGIFLGVLFINHVQEGQKAEITEYFNTFMEKMKNTQNLDYMELLKASIGQNLILAIVLWFFGTTVIGIPVVFRVSNLSWALPPAIPLLFALQFWDYHKAYGLC